MKKVQVSINPTEIKSVNFNIDDYKASSKKYKENSLYLEIDALNWMVQGDLFHWDYNIYEAERLVASISKEWFHFSDVYVIDIKESKDALRVLMVALAIDALHCHD